MWWLNYHYHPTVSISVLYVCIGILPWHVVVPLSPYFVHCKRRVAYAGLAIRVDDDITYVYGGREEVVGRPLRDGVPPHSLYFTLNSHVSRVARCARRFTVVLNIISVHYIRVYERIRSFSSCSRSLLLIAIVSLNFDCEIRRQVLLYTTLEFEEKEMINYKYLVFNARMDDVQLDGKSNIRM